MPRILFIDQFADLGGGQRILLDVVRHFRASGWECMVALPADGRLTEILVGEKVAVARFQLPGMRAGKKSLADKLAFLPAAHSAKREIGAIAREFGADLLFCNGPRAALPSVLAATSLKLPVVCAVHLIFHGVERSILNWCFGRPCVQGVTFCSSIAKRPFEEMCAKKWTMTGNWVSPEFTETPRTLDSRRLFGLNEGDLAVGVVGRLSQKKGQRLFLEAMQPLAKSDPRVRLLIAGSSDFEAGSEESLLRELALELGMSDQTRFLGSVENTVALLDSLDVLVVPSLWEEPFGLVAVEGMARGVPVVATRSGGLVDIVLGGSTGLLVDKKAQALGCGISRLIEDRDLRVRMGRAGFERARAQFAAAPRLDALVQACRGLAANWHES